MLSSIIVEGAHQRALLAQQIQIDVGERDLPVLSEALALCKQNVILENGCLAIPSQVSSGFPRTSGCINIGGQTAR